MATILAMTTQRRLHRLAAVLAAVTIWLAVASAAGAATPSVVDPYQWELHGTTSQGQPYAAPTHYDYSFSNDRTTRFLTGHSRTFGVALDWGDGKTVTAGYHLWSFRRHSGWTAAIAHGEKVAIYNNFTHRYLVRGDEHFGIDLAYSSTPAYDWKVLVRGNETAFYNTDENDYLVNYPRTFGADLMWLRDVADQTDTNPNVTAWASVEMRALPQGGPYQAYTGTFGAGVSRWPGWMLRVDATDELGAGFIKHGYGTSDCTTPGAVVWLVHGETMTDAQRAAIFGSTKPILPLTFNTCYWWEPGFVHTGVKLALQYYGVEGFDLMPLLKAAAPAQTTTLIGAPVA